MNEQKQKHTPGPWEVGPEGQVRAMTGRQICDPRQWTSEGQANASLIAAAPELLAALKEVYELCGEVLKRQPNAGEYAHNMAAGLRGKVSAAIKRAEGGAE